MPILKHMTVVKDNISKDAIKKLHANLFRPTEKNPRVISPNYDARHVRLNCLFVWDSSPEGHEFWSHIYNELYEK